MAQAAYRKTAGGGLWGANLYRFDALPSTNTWAMEHVSDYRHGDVIRALRQTGGHGRFQRPWLTPGTCCLTLSVILRDPAAQEDGRPPACMLPATALAVARTLEQFRIRASLKWPNDVLVDGRKIAGVLAEGDPAAGTLVLGIGLNVNLTRPALDRLDLPQPATSMTIVKERLFDMTAVGNELLSLLEITLDALHASPQGWLAEKWRPLDALAGRHITIETPQGKTAGRYAGMQRDGRLRLVDAANKEHAFWSGDVTVARS